MAEAKETKAEQREITRSEVEVLILISGLILTPAFYLWQTAVSNVQALALPLWQNYLASQLGSDYGFSDAMALYVTPFGFLKVLPIDVLLWLYDTVIILGTLSIVIFGYALIEVERTDPKRVRELVLKGRSLLTAVLMLIIFFAIEHLLRFTMLPFRLALGWYDSWTIFLVAALSTIIIKTVLYRNIRQILGKGKI